MRNKTRVGAVALAAMTLLVPPAMSTAQAPEAAAPPPDSEFQKVTLNDFPGEPMDLAVLPDGRVLHTTRQGVVWLHDPDTGLNTRAGTIPVYQHDEEGLQSVALDPNFEQNRWVYLYYSPPLDTPADNPATPGVNEGDAPFFGTPADFEPFKGLIRLSRFKFGADQIQLGTEQQIIDVPVDRGVCCHVGGDIVFDSTGNLYLSTGDDTNPFESQGYAPIDEQANRNPAFDAQRTSANTNDLRGKVLRIRPAGGGGYTIPDGNMFAPGTPQTRPEIYAMGFRNPFRIEIDPETDDLYVGDYSPDAGAADPARGPAGRGRWMIVREPANFGWPYCATAELPYVDGEFVPDGPDSGTDPDFVSNGEEFDCANPVNESRNNTGMEQLPPVTQPDVWYTYPPSFEFPDLGPAAPGGDNGIGPMGGPAYDFDVRDTRGNAAVAWPEYYDGVPLFYEWTRDYVKAFHLSAGGDLDRIEPMLASFRFAHVMDMEFGPEGALYILEYGDGFFVENHPLAQLARIDYIGPGGNHAPQPMVSSDVTEGGLPLTVSFSSAGTSDAEGDRLRYAWDFDADGAVDSTQPNPTFTYEEPGVFRATLKVTDQGGKDRGKSASAEVIITASDNQEPVVEFVTPTDGQPFSFGDAVPFEVSITDDEPVDCSRVRVDYILGHAGHGHGITTQFGCSGTIQTSAAGHTGDDLTGIFTAQYTDTGVPELTGSDVVELVPTD
ncbi:MAG: PQQ-dependent sugar dehydrogenase [Nocardioidaceae bacterium]